MTIFDDLIQWVGELKDLQPSVVSGEYDDELLDEWDDECKKLVEESIGNRLQNCAIWRWNSARFAEKYNAIFKDAQANCDAFYEKPTLMFGFDLDFEKMLAKAPGDFVEDYFEAIIEGYLFSAYPGKDNLEKAIGLTEAYLGNKLSSALTADLRSRRRFTPV